MWNSSSEQAWGASGGRDITVITAGETVRLSLALRLLVAETMMQVECCVAAVQFVLRNMHLDGI